MDRIFCNFDPLLPLTLTLLLKAVIKSIVVIWATHLPLICPHGLNAFPKHIINSVGRFPIEIKTQIYNLLHIAYHVC